jgi:hypothetical protein
LAAFDGFITTLTSVSRLIVWQGECMSMQESTHTRVQMAKGVPTLE